jgi:hypothetical protein
MALDLGTNPGRQTAVAANPARKLIFFEDNDLCYNYGTGQWTRCPAYASYTYFSINNKDADIGLGLIPNGSYGSFEEQLTAYVSQDVTITTGEMEPNQGGRVVVSGVRPRIDDGTWTVRVGTRNSTSTVVSWSTSTSLNSRTGMANFREEGRYFRVEYSCTGGHTNAMGADVEYSPQGRY